MLIQRKVASVMWQGKPAEFDKFWPIDNQVGTVHKTWGTKEEAETMRQQIMKAHNIKM